jgi:hypothetical protein
MYFVVACWKYSQNIRDSQRRGNVTMQFRFQSFNYAKTIDEYFAATAWGLHDGEPIMPV